jgi:hypothetical protein
LGVKNFVSFSNGWNYGYESRWDCDIQQSSAIVVDSVRWVLCTRVMLIRRGVNNFVGFSNGWN